jgi:hypothetical protein
VVGVVGLGAVKAFSIPVGKLTVPATLGSADLNASKILAKPEVEGVVGVVGLEGRI